MKRKSKITLSVLIVLAVSGLIFYLCIPASPRQTVEGALGMKLPDSARNVEAICDWQSSGSTMIEMWAVMDMPITDARALADELGLTVIPPDTSVKFGELKKPFKRWDVMRAHEGIPVENTWLKTGPVLRPAMLGMVWIDGELYLYQLGFYGRTSGK